MRQESRKLSKSERDELQGIVAWSTQLGRIFLFMLAVAVVGLVFRKLFQVAGVDGPVWAVPTIILALLLYRRAGKWTGGPAFRRLVRLDVEQNEARVTIMVPIDVTEIEELEDEGPAYLVKTDEDLWVLLSGQDMLPYQRRGFPWTEFGAAEAPNSGVFFGLSKIGESMPVSRTIPPLAYETMRDLGAFDRTMVILDEDRRTLVSKAIAASATTD